MLVAEIGIEILLKVKTTLASAEVSAGAVAKADQRQLLSILQVKME